MLDRIVTAAPLLEVDLRNPMPRTEPVVEQDVRRWQSEVPRGE